MSLKEGKKKCEVMNIRQIIALLKEKKLAKREVTMTVLRMIGLLIHVFPGMDKH